MAQQNTRPYTFVLAAGGTYQIGVNGDYVRALSAPVNDLTVRFDSGEPCPLPQGVGIERGYSTLEFGSATGQTVTVYAGYGRVDDTRATGNFTVNTILAPGNTIGAGGDVSCASGTVTLLVGVDLTRQYAIVANPSSNTATVRIGPAGVTASSGMILEPGQSIPIPCTAALYAYQSSGSTATVSVGIIKQV